jgi:hypothetical protein
MSPAKKTIAGVFAAALANCLMDHLVQWCLFEVLGLDCPRH